MAPASQDFRDGAATGSAQLARRLRAVELLGVKLTMKVVLEVDDDIQSTWGGRAAEQDSHVLKETFR